MRTLLAIVITLTLTACSSLDSVRLVDRRDTVWDPVQGQSLLDVVEPWDSALTAQARAKGPAAR